MYGNIPEQLNSITNDEQKSFVLAVGGTFKLNAISDGGQVPEDLAGMHQPLDARSMIQGLKLVVIPDNSELDKLTSTANLDKASLTIDSVLESKTRTNSKGKTETYTSVTDLETWRQAHPVTP